MLKRVGKFVLNAFLLLCAFMVAMMLSRTAWIVLAILSLWIPLGSIAESLYRLSGRDDEEFFDRDERGESDDEKGGAK